MYLHAGRVPRAFSKSLVARLDFFFFTGVRLRQGAGRKSKPTSTRLVSDKSPIILRTGTGSLRTSVGMARIWSPLESWGRSAKSITSIIYRPLRWISQIFFKFENAVSDL